MAPITHDCAQGSPEWLSLRANYFTASEASAMAGKSKYQSRNDLLKAKSIGAAEVDSGTQRLFDRGHAAEAAARPIVEAKLGEDLFPVTMSRVVDGLPLLASLDGITMMGDVIWETKLINQSIKDDIEQGQIHDHYAYQMEQQLLVAGAEKCYFTTSDGTEAGTFGIWYTSVPEIRAALLAGWHQFAIDLAAYQHREEKPVVVLAPIEDLPALIVEMTGAVTSSNLATFQAVVLGRIQAINTDIKTDEDFASAEKMVKFLDDGEKKLELVKAQALSQTSSIDELFRAIASLQGEMKAKRLTLDKLVKARKDSIRIEIQQEAKDKLAEHIVGLGRRLGNQSFMPSIKADFAEAMKGKRSIASLHDAVDTELARAKIEANRIADLIQINLASIEKQAEYLFLFNDMTALLLKANDDLEMLIDHRINGHKAAEEKKQASEVDRIRAEEQAKAKREQDVREADARRAESELKRQQDELTQRRNQASAQYEKLKELVDKKPRIQTKLNLDRAELTAWEERVAACKEQAAGPAHPIMCPHCQGLTQMIHGVLVEYQEPVQKYNPELVAKLPEYEKALLLSRSAVSNGERDLRAVEDAELQMQTIANQYQFKEAA